MSTEQHTGVLRLYHTRVLGLYPWPTGLEEHQKGVLPCYP